MLFKKVLISLGAAGALGGAGVGVYHSVKKTDEQKPSSEGEGEKGPDKNAADQTNTDDTNPPPAPPVIEHDSGNPDSGDTVVADDDDEEEDNGESDGSNENGKGLQDTKSRIEGDTALSNPENPTGDTTILDTNLNTQEEEVEQVKE